MSRDESVSKTVHAKRLAVGTAGLFVFGTLGLILWTVAVILESMPQWASAVVILTPIFAIGAYVIGWAVEEFTEVERHG